AGDHRATAGAEPSAEGPAADSPQAGAGDRELGGWRHEWPVPPQVHSRSPWPIHPAGERVKARQVRRLVWQALSRAESRLESLPAALRRRHRLPAAGEALRAVHFPWLCPKPTRDAEASRARLAFEELLLHQTVLSDRRA